MTSDDGPPHRGGIDCELPEWTRAGQRFTCYCGRVWQATKRRGGWFQPKAERAKIVQVRRASY